MGEFVDKTKGVTNDLVGNVKQGVGKMVDSDKLRAEGLAQEAKGELQKKTGAVKGALGDDI